jgi:putative redox protein
MSTSHHIALDYKSGMTFQIDQDGHHYVVDAHKENGGNDNGPAPKALMLSALAGCTAMDVVSLLNKMKVTFSDFNIAVEGQLTEEHPKMYHTVDLTYTIKIDNEEERAKMEKAVHLSQTKYCGVAAMTRSFAKLDYEIVYI